MDENLSGVINIYKEKNYSSHDVVNIVRRALTVLKQDIRAHSIRRRRAFFPSA